MHISLSKRSSGTSKEIVSEEALAPIININIVNRRFMWTPANASTSAGKISLLCLFTDIDRFNQVNGFTRNIVCYYNLKFVCSYLFVGLHDQLNKISAETYRLALW